MEEKLDTDKRKNISRSETLTLKSDKDLVEIRELGQSFAEEMGFSDNDRTIISTALSEICRNVIEYAGRGEVIIEKETSYRDSIKITVKDDGPGIKDVNKALQEGYTSGMGLGIGLPGAKRIMDEFEIQTQSGKGTTIIMSKWVNNHNNVF